MQCLTWIASTVLASFMTRDSCFCIRIQNSFRLFWKSSTRVLCLSGRFWVSWRSFRQWLACRPPLPALCTKWLQDKCRPERASWYVDHMRIFCVDIYTKHFRLVSLMYFTSRQDPSVSTLCLIVMIIAYRMSPSPFDHWPLATELFRSPLPSHGKLCRRTSRQRRHGLFLGKLWRPISSIVLSPNPL